MPWFRGSDGDTGKSNGQVETLKPSNAVVVKSLLTQEDIELEYLNEISRLTKEKEEARDEIDRQSRDSDALNSSLRESNDSLETKVKTLEEKLNEVSVVQNRSGSPDSPHVQSSQVNQLKKKLKKYNESNKTLSAKVQKLRQRRADGDDFSDVSSVGSLSMMSVVSSMTNRQQLTDLKWLQDKYDFEFGRNKHLEQKLKIVEVNKENSEKLLEKTRIESEDQITRHKTEIKNLEDELTKANRSLANAKNNSVDASNQSTHEGKETSRHVIIDLEREMMEKEKIVKELQSKFDEKCSILKNLEEEYSRKCKEIEILQAEKQSSTTRLQSLESTLAQEQTEKKNLHNEVKTLKALSININDSDEAMQDLEGNDSPFLQQELDKLKITVAEKDEEINELGQKMNKIIAEKQDLSSTIDDRENTLVEMKLKNAQCMEQIEDIEEKLRIEQNKDLAISTPENHRKRDLKRISELEEAKKIRDVELQELRTKTKASSSVARKLKILESDLKVKSVELDVLKSEKNQSTKRLQTLESDFVTTQQKGAKTWGELEELREQYELEQKVKADLQTKLKRMDSVENMVVETKRLSENTLKGKDKEIEKLKRLLAEANIAKGATEKKLVGFMNDSVEQESTRNLMKQELEDQLIEENERASQLKTLIKVKEEDIDKVRKDFDNLAKTMQNGLEKKRNQITELNGELLERENLLITKEREIQLMYGDIDDIELRHASEIKRLQVELETSYDKIELENLRKHNGDLDYTILSLNQEIGRLRAMLLVNQPKDETISGDTVEFLRKRNKKLKSELRLMKQESIRSEI
jgi:chromosome segregation ATPase